MTSAAGLAPLELWGGFECTLNRVGDTQFDQLALTGHYARADDDLSRLTALGIRTIRYPILWERIVAGQPDGDPWGFTDARMAHLRALGVEPIVGLLHHGSGPLDTSLLDPGFAERFAEYAREVAERYPWVTMWTPVNEPLTTARFATLYGAWYPHLRDDEQFLRATLNQVRATRLAMEAIRSIIPRARLVQTEDLGFTHATHALRYQAEFENERRWLAFDLLCGRFGASHPLRRYAGWARIDDGEIDRAIGDGCRPDIIGINHYVTSERWLDERLERYPSHSHGGNHRARYADVEAVRALPDGVAGPQALLAAAWQRYGLPLAVTEAHIGCTREQQLRWLREVWDAASALRHAGADIRAVTAWAALGTRDWSSLVTRIRGDYEPGLFDIRSPAPRPTAVAKMAKSLATRGRHEHPVADAAGWWRCPDRLAYHVGPHDVGTAPGAALRGSTSDRSTPLLIAGAGGTLGSALVRVCADRGLRVRAMARHELDITDRAAVDRALHDTGAWAVVNAAGHVRVDDAEADPVACRRANVAGAFTLAAACSEQAIPLVMFSSDLVFDGAKGAPYIESDRVAPLGAYGASKAEAEARVLAVLPSALVVRTAAFFGPWDDWNFATRTLRRLASGFPVEAAEDLIVSPTHVPDLVHASLDLLIDGERGIWHLVNEGAVSWADFARMLAHAAGLDATLVDGRDASGMGYAARRPANAALASERATLLPTLDDAITRYIRLSGVHGAHTQQRARQTVAG